MYRRTPLLLALLGALSTPAFADPAAQGRYLAATCTSCHGDRGISLSKDIPSLAGRPAGELLEALKGFRDDSRKSTVMGQLARGYSEAQLQLIADWFARQTAGGAR